MTNQERVEEWMEKMGGFVSKNPTLIVPDNVRMHRMRLVVEEPVELMEAIQEDDLCGIADGIGDALVVILGAAANYGLNAQACFDAVMDSNETKDTLNRHGKGGKGPDFVPPDLEPLLKSWRK